MAGLGRPLSGPEPAPVTSSLTFAGISKTIQCQKPLPVGASGSKHVTAKLFVADGWQDYTNASIEEVCAFQYSAMNQAILEAREAIPGNQWTEMFYEDLVRDPVGEFRRAFASAGLGFSEAMRRYCSHVLETPFNAFSGIAVDKWKSQHNRTRIERVLPAVSGVARRMGYEVD